MRNLKTLLALPSTLLTLLLGRAAAHGLESRESLDFTKHESVWKRDQDALSHLAIQRPHGIRKMSDDPGEKFWIHYWEFDDMQSSDSDGNVTIPELALALHGGSRPGRAIFARDASCPTGTNSCASIGYSDSCCPTGSACITVTDTGNGPVGCCAAGKTCGNTVPDCNTALGYSACPNSTNKGCCIPGYACSGNICVNVGTQYFTPTSTTTTTTSSVQAPVSVLTVTSVNTSGYTTTATVTATVTQSVFSTTSSDTAVAPVRPTTDTIIVVPASVPVSTSTTTSTVTTLTTSSSNSVCPTGYYQCSAVYLGGCCQVDRDCHTTTCPPTASTTLIAGVVTVVAPTGATANAPTCATGWYSCAASDGGNCCPNGYSCGQTNCPASISGAAAQNKQAPNEATGHTLAWMYIILAVTAAVGMVML